MFKKISILSIFIASFLNASSLNNTIELKEYQLEQVSLTGSDLNIKPNDSIDDSANLNKFLNSLEKNKFYTLNLDSGIYNLENNLNINKSNLKIKGLGKDKTKFVYKKESSFPISIIDIKGFQGKKIGRVVSFRNTDNVIDSNFLIFDPQKNILSEDFFNSRSKNISIWLKQNNEKDFILNKMESSWFSEKPEIIQEINNIEYCSQIESTLSKVKKLLKCKLKNKLNHSYSQKMTVSTEVWQTKSIENIYLEDFSIIYEPNLDFDFEKNQFIFNEMKNLQINSISIEFATNINLNNIDILNSGKNPIYLDKINNSNFKNIYLKNSYSKDNDNGSFIIYRTFDSNFENIEMENLKFLIVSWSSGRNYFKNFKMNNPLFLKGGFTHNNDFSNFEILLNENSPFNEIYENVFFQDNTTPPNYKSNNTIHINSFVIKDYRLIKF